jgi:hypothetical protein
VFFLAHQTRYGHNRSKTVYKKIAPKMVRVKGFQKPKIQSLQLRKGSKDQLGCKAAIVDNVDRDLKLKPAHAAKCPALTEMKVIPSTPV